MTFEVARSRGMQDEWRVEAINEQGEGEIYIALFSGPEAQSRAEEYAAWKNEPTHARRSQRRPVAAEKRAHV